MEGGEMERKQMISGQPLLLRSGEVKYEACCDCGLVHIVFYSIKFKKGKQYIERVSYRDDWETKGVRNSKNRP